MKSKILLCGRHRQAYLGHKTVNHIGMGWQEAAGIKGESR